VVLACTFSWRMTVTHANGQPTLACYRRGEDGTYVLGALMLLSFRDGQISELSAFLDPEIYDAFEIPRVYR
jgi:ketosteroid isomerase-like protein